MAVLTEHDLERLDAKIEELRQVTREANTVLKDLQQAQRGAKAEIERQAEHWKEQLKEIIVDYVKAELNSLGDMFHKAEKQLSDKFFGHFEELIKQLYEGDYGGMSLTEIAKVRKENMNRLMMQRMIDGA